MQAIEIKQLVDGKLITDSAAVRLSFQYLEIFDRMLQIRECWVLFFSNFFQEDPFC